jgi:hypothetical protein
VAADCFNRPSQTSSGLFQPTAHVVSVPIASTIAILDLDRGTMHATTPGGARAWASLIDDTPLQRRSAARPQGERLYREDARILADMTDYLLKHSLVEPNAHRGDGMP